MTTQSLSRDLFHLAIPLVAFVMVTSPLYAQEGDVKVTVSEPNFGSNQPSITLDASTKPTGDNRFRVVINGKVLYMTDDAADVYEQIKENGGTFKTEADAPISLTREEAFDKYMAAYDKMTALMSEEEIDEAAAQKAYQEYMKAKSLYNSSD